MRRSPDLTLTESIARLEKAVGARRVPLVEAALMHRLGLTYEQARAHAQRSRRRGGRLRMSRPLNGWQGRTPR